jgi:hypothetical protein
MNDKNYFLFHGYFYTNLLLQDEVYCYSSYEAGEDVMVLVAVAVTFLGSNEAHC